MTYAFCKSFFVRVIVVASFATMTLVLPQSLRAAIPADIQAQIDVLQNKVDQKKKDLQDLDQQIKQYQSLVTQKRRTAISLTGEVGLLDSRLKRNQLDIDLTKDQIAKLTLEISLLDSSIAYRGKQIDIDRALLGSLTRSLYAKEFRRSPIEILASYNSFSDFFIEIQNVVQLQNSVNTTLHGVKQNRRQLQTQQDDRQEKIQEMALQNTKLQQARDQLQEDKVLKQSLLTETQSSELQYRYLLAELKKQQDDADAEISSLEKSLRAKLNISQQITVDQNVGTLSWPVSPTRGLSTQFRDPDYPFRYVFEHPGIDIRAGQGTPVRAAASGVVGRAKDAGKGYSYVLILHANNISTVYGHLSRIITKDGAYVDRGDIIGYSGGLPGSPGAGPLTTGPHLHFETRSRGIPVNPLNYLGSL